jgi:hypothetical protein
MSIVMTIDQPVLGKDIVYEMFPQNGNYVESMFRREIENSYNLSIF